MRAHFQVSLPYVLYRLVTHGAPYGDIVERLTPISRVRWKTLNLEKYTSDDSADFGFPAWQAFPAQLGVVQSEILFARPRNNDQPWLRSIELLLLEFFQSHGGEKARVSFTQYYVGKGLGSLDAHITVEDFDTRVVTSAFADAFDDYLHKKVFPELDEGSLRSLEWAGHPPANKRKLNAPRPRFMDTYSAGLVVMVDDSELDSFSSELLRCAREFTSNQAFEPNLSELPVYASGVGQYCAIVRGDITEVRTCILWSLGVLVWALLSDLGAEHGIIARISDRLSEDIPPDQIETTLRELDVAERWLLFARGLGDPSSLISDDLERAVYISVWEQTDCGKRVMVVESDLQRLRNLLQIRVSQKDRRQQRRLSFVLYLLTVVGVLNVIGDALRSYGPLLGKHSEHQQLEIAAAGQSIFLVLGVLLGVVLFRR